MDLSPIMLKSWSHNGLRRLVTIYAAFRSQDWILLRVEYYVISNKCWSTVTIPTPKFVREHLKLSGSSALSILHLLICYGAFPKKPKYDIFRWYRTKFAHLC